MNVNEIITQKFLDKLEKGDVPWHREWRILGDGPMNLKTKKPYNGVNVFILLMENWPSQYWASYKQWGSLGANVMRGCKGTPIVFWKWFEKEDGTERPFLRYSTVFNMDQVENLDEKYVPKKEELPTFVPLKKAERIMNFMPQRPEVNYGGDRAYYMPVTDQIQLPLKKQFKTPEDFYSVAFHELVHATGHNSRLNRKDINNGSTFGSHSYSKEELVAELGASFLCAECSILKHTFENSAGYLSSWISKLQKNPKWIVEAASKADKAFKFIVDKKT